MSLDLKWDVLNAIIETGRNPTIVETPCLICGEGITIHIHDKGPKVCEHCRLAVMEMRKKLNASCGNCANWQHEHNTDICWCPIVRDRIEMHDTPCRRWRLGK